MNLDFEFNAKTLLSSFWQKVKNNFTTVQTEFNAFTTTPATTEFLGPVKLLGSEYGDAAVIGTTGSGGLYIKNGGIYEDLIRDEAVRTKHIQDYNITESKIYNGAVTSNKLGTGAVTNGKIYDGAVTENKIGTGAVTENKIGTRAVTVNKLGDDVKEDINSRMKMPDFSHNTGTPVSMSDRKNIDTFLPRLNAFKSVGCIGDSLASGACYREVTNDGQKTLEGGEMYEYSWGQYLSRMTGNKYYNWSKSGLTAGEVPSSSQDGAVFDGIAQWSGTAYATECLDGNHKCQAYIIGLGVNDSSSQKDAEGNVIYDANGYPTPNISVADFRNGYMAIINSILETNPDAKIFCLTIPSAKAEGWINPYGTGDAVQIDTFKFNNAIRSAVTTYHDSHWGQVFLVDLYTNYYNYFARSGSVLAEYWRAAHGNAIAYQYCALLIGNAIERIMETNPDDFSAVEFIPYSNGEPNFKAYDTRPKQVGVWIDGTPIWRVAINRELTTSETQDKIVILTTADMGIINNENVSVLVDSNLALTESGGAITSQIPLQRDYGVEYTATNWNVGTFNSFIGYVEFVTPKSNIQA